MNTGIDKPLYSHRCNCTQCQNHAEFCRIVATIPEEKDRQWMVEFLDDLVESDFDKDMEIAYLRGEFPISGSGQAGDPDNPDPRQFGASLPKEDR